MLLWNWITIVDFVFGTRKRAGTTDRRYRSTELYVILKSTENINRGDILARLSSCRRRTTNASNIYFLDKKEGLAPLPRL